LNFLQYRNAQQFLDEIGLTVEEGLKVVDKELKRLKGE